MQNTVKHIDIDSNYVAGERPSHKMPVASEKGGSDSFLKVWEQQWESHVGVVGKVRVLHQRRNYVGEGWPLK